jgi:RimJ/RimL family protein N-acetyltransferase
MRNPLRGERLRLTAMTEADLPSLAAWYGDGEFLRHLDAVPAVPKNESQLGEWMRSNQARADCMLFAIRRLDAGNILGYVMIEDVLWNQRVTFFSMAIGDPAERNQGYGTEALELMLGFAFHELNLYRVQLTVFEYNLGAIRAYERVGFRREGVFREFLERDGRRYDMFLYGILRREWEARRTEGAQPSGAASSGA